MVNSNTCFHPNLVVSFSFVFLKTYFEFPCWIWLFFLVGGIISSKWWAEWWLMDELVVLSFSPCCCCQIVDQTYQYLMQKLQNFIFSKIFTIRLRLKTWKTNITNDCAHTTLWKRLKTALQTTVVFCSTTKNETKYNYF